MEQRVDRIEPLDKRRSKVFLDGDFAFVLYNGELGRYGIEEGCLLTEAAHRRVMSEAILPRAREKAVLLLKASGRTEKELRLRLKRAWFPEEAVEDTVAFLKEYHYLDDEAYVRNYLELYGNRKSRAEIIFTLQQKGADRELIRELCAELEPDEESQIRALLAKRRYDAAGASLPEKRRMAAYLSRRGYAAETIRRALDGNISPL